jgi:hypothetical protein
MKIFFGVKVECKNNRKFKKKVYQIGQIN